MMAHSKHAQGKALSLSTSDASTPDYLHEGQGLLSWLFSTDHKRLAVLQLIGMSIAALAGGLIAVVLHIEKATPQLSVLSQDSFAAAFTMHGALMLLLLLFPAIPAVLGAFIIPLQLGAHNLSFPRLHLLSVQLWTAGALCFLASMGLGGASNGYTLSLPLSLELGPPELFLVAGMGCATASCILCSVVLMTSIISLRTRGLFWSRTTPFSWSLLAHGSVTLIAAPLVLVSLVTLVAEHWFGLGLFDPQYGGDPLLFQNYFWFGMHALSYSSVVPALGVISEIFATLSRRGTQAKLNLVIGLVGLSVLALLSWGIQVPSAGHGTSYLAFCSLMTLLGIIPASFVLRSWFLTLQERKHNTAATWFALGAALCFVCGGLATLPLAALSSGLVLSGTSFEMGQSHLIYSSVALALLAGLHLWWPKMTGKTYSPALAQSAAVLLTLGICVTFLPQLSTGLGSLPIRLAEYPAPFQWQQLLALAGSVLQGCAVLVTAGNLLASWGRENVTEKNPWHARGLEWACPSPPPADNFLSTAEQRN